MSLKLFHPYRPILTPLQTVQIQMRQLVSSPPIGIYTVCHSVIALWLKSQSATMDVFKLRDGRVHIRNLGVNKRINLHVFTDIVHRFVTMFIVPVVALSRVESHTVFLAINLIGFSWRPVCIFFYTRVGPSPHPFLLDLQIIACRPKLIFSSCDNRISVI